MKVLLAHSRYRSSAPSGENRVVDEEAAALRVRGHQVELFERHSDDIAGWSLQQKAALPVRTVWNSEARRDIGRAIERNRPDVVHVHNTFPLLTGSILVACRDAEVPVVATLHNYKLLCAKGDFFRDGAVCHSCADGRPTAAVAHGCYRGSRILTLPVVAGSLRQRDAWRSLVSAYIFISAAEQKLLGGLRLPQQRVFVKHNFVPERVVPTRRPQQEVLYLGRLDEAKGIPFLMRAWDAFRAASPESALRLVIAGGGPLGPETESWAAGHPSVDFAGLVPAAEVADLLGRARAVILPSQWEETFGLVAVEAMAAGVAPAATAHGSFPELITTGHDGVLFDPHEPRSLVGVLQDVDAHPDRWERLGMNARETYLRCFRPEAGIAQLLEIYRFAIADPVFNHV